MGWAGGSRMMDEIIAVVSKVVSDDQERVELYSSLIDIFEEFDCDTLHECVGEDEDFDEAYKEKYPDEDELLESEDQEDWDDQSGGNF